jgi:hypothetical protein
VNRHCTVETMPSGPYIPTVGEPEVDTIVAWTSVDPLAMSTPIQQQISALEPELPIYNVLTMDQILGKSTATQGFAANLVLAFAACHFS